MTQHYDTLYIGGRWTAPSSDRRITVVSPNSGEVIGSVPQAQEADVDAAVDAARRAFPGWAATPPADRAAALRRFATGIDARSDEFVERVSSQNGMPVAVASQLEPVYPSVLLNFYVGLIENQVEDVRDGLFGGKVRVEHAPIGVIGAIAPWNFPQHCRRSSTPRPWPPATPSC